MKKIAVVLFNLGGPDKLESVRPFLFNLFHDPAIFQVPQPIRYLLAKLVSSRRAPFARDVYAKLGGSSPLLQNTQAQALALEASLNAASSEPLFKVFIAMRYWHPMASETAGQVREFSPDEIILLPLYPQFSTTTTQSSFDDWCRQAKAVGLNVPTKTICCYPQDNGLIKAMANKAHALYEEAKHHGTPRFLFSAHGLPEKVILAGDPYQKQCEKTAAALRQALGVENPDTVLCFQSRVGPLKWIGPATDGEIKRAGADKVPVIVVPIAFVSEHSETLVEIDMEYRHLALSSGVPYFGCARTVGDDALFISSLTQMVRDAASQKNDCLCGATEQVCACDNTCPCGAFRKSGF